jgi:hypothetical protein
MHTSDFVLLLLLALAAGLFIGGYFVLMAAESKRRNRESKKEADERLERVRSADRIGENLDATGYNASDSNLEMAVDPDGKLLQVIGPLSSRSYRYGRDKQGGYHLYIYDDDGARRLLTLETFQKELWEILGEDDRRKRLAGFEEHTAAS